MTTYTYEIGQRNKKKQIICGSKKSRHKQDPKPCQSTYIFANGRCHVHNGDAKSGKLNPNYKHGRHVVANAPQRVLERVEAILDNGDALNQMPTIALLMARFPDLLSQLSEGGGATLWALFQSGVHRIGATIKAKDDKGMTESYKNLEALVKMGVEDEYTWLAINKLAQNISKLIQTEHKRQIDNEMMVQVSSVLLYTEQLRLDVLDEIRKHVPESTANKIGAGIGKRFENRLNVSA